MRNKRFHALGLLCLLSLYLTGVTLRGQVAGLSSNGTGETAITSDADVGVSSPSVPTGPSRDLHKLSGEKMASGAPDPARIQDALDALNNVLRRDRESGDRVAEANVLGAIANSENALHQQQKALESLQAELGIWRDLGNQEGRALTLAHMGDVYRGWGFPEQANHFYRDALAIYPPEDKRGHAATLNNLGLTYFSLRNKKKCLEKLNEALASYRALGDRHGEALALSNLGSTYNFLVNDPQKALEMFQEAVTKLELVEDRSSEANALDNMGVVWLNLRKPEMASLSFQHAITLFRAVGDAQGEAAVRRHMEALDQPGTIASGP
jgi:tetratricopeptide (TPR) repeat protein